MLLRRDRFRMSNRSTKTAFGGIITSLSTFLIILSGVISVLSYALSALSGLLILLCALETGYRRGMLVFISTSFMSMLLSVDKSSAILFIMLLGYYPMLKFKIERIRLKSVRFLIKMIIFNVAVIAAFFITMKLFEIPEQSLVWFGISVPVIMLVMGNFTFIIYDRCITNLCYIYFYKYRKTFRHIAKLD